MKIHDISVVLDEKTVTYPGDPAVKILQVKQVQQDGWNLSGISLGAHSGTHIDSLAHIENSKKNCLALPLERCYGECTVLDMTHLDFGTQIDREHLTSQLMTSSAHIVLLKTKNSIIRTAGFREDFVCLSESGAQYLLESAIQTVGIDYLSIGSKETHEILLHNEILVFENLCLEHIVPKNYTFIGFPLKLATEGAPTRAVLIED